MNKTQQDAIVAAARLKLGRCSVIIHQLSTMPDVAANPDKHLIELKNEVDTVKALLEEEELTSE